MRTLFRTLLVGAMIFPGLALAQTGTGGRGDNSGPGSRADASGAAGGLENPIGADNLNDLIVLILNIVVQIGVVVLTLMIVYCGFLFVVAQGNEEKLRTARTAFFWTVIGGLLVLGANVIAEGIKNTVGAL